MCARVRVCVILYAVYTDTVHDWFGIKDVYDVYALTVKKLLCIGPMTTRTMPEAMSSRPEHMARTLPNAMLCRGFPKPILHHECVNLEKVRTVLEEI
jgi:hypothetical protein